MSVDRIHPGGGRGVPRLLQKLEIVRQRRELAMPAAYPFLRAAAALFPMGTDYYFSNKAAEIIERNPDIWAGIVQADMRGMYGWFDAAAARSLGLTPVAEAPPPNIVKTFYRVTVGDNPQIVYVRVDRGGQVEIWAPDDFSGKVRLIEKARPYPIKQTFPRLRDFLIIAEAMRSAKGEIVDVHADSIKPEEAGLYCYGEGEAVDAPIYYFPNSASGTDNLPIRISSAFAYFSLYIYFLNLSRRFNLAQMDLINLSGGVGDFEFIAGLFFRSVKGINGFEAVHDCARVLAEFVMRKYAGNPPAVEFVRADARDWTPWRGYEAVFFEGDHFFWAGRDESRRQGDRELMAAIKVSAATEGRLVMVDSQFTEAYPGFRSIEDDQKKSPLFKVFDKMPGLVRVR